LPLFFFVGTFTRRIAFSIFDNTGGLRKTSTSSGSNCVPLPSAMARVASVMLRAWL
jgi:hypothetical protein